MLGNLLGRLVGRGASHGGTSGQRRRTYRRVRPRMKIGAVVDPVPDLLSRLRELRDDLEYHVEPDGWLLLLAWDPTKERVREAHKMLALGLNTFDNLIMADGFSILAMLEPSAAWNGELLTVAQNIIDKATPKKVEAVHAERMLEADGTMHELRGEAHLRDRLTSEARSDHKILFRNRRSFSTSEVRRANDPSRSRAESRRAEADFLKAAELMRRFPSLPIVR